MGSLLELGNFSGRDSDGIIEASLSGEGGFKGTCRVPEVDDSPSEEVADELLKVDDKLCDEAESGNLRF